MSDLAISINNISKAYSLGTWQARSTTLAEACTKIFRNGFRKPSNSEFWALRDVSLEVKRGEILGIIGRNGAGKTTLLKILSRITEPTSGQIDLYGRVGSLLEVGTGFHPELTGRENIYLNGAILGMSRSEIDAKFDSIVAFAETEAFLDTPVKRYSSGMYVRLAFAVAAHLDPEILIVDEVLAVGDIQFQKKSMARMESAAANEGKTILFVSHNMGAISALTTTALYLERGQVAALGPTQQVVNAYLADHCRGAGTWTAQAKNGHPLQILEARMLDLEENVRDEFEAHLGFLVELRYEVREPVRNVLVEFFIFSADGVHLLTSGDHDTTRGSYEQRSPGSYRARVRVPGDLLNLGTYSLRINSGTHQATFDSEDTILFRVIEPRQLTSRNDRQGLLVPMLPWETVEIPK
ncbi:MAG: lipopolysaccharide transport system ATP-binding protein [Verrucomicrobiota bacterium]|jgi:lipopolysaccharide transport system ATP-binding protein